MYFRASSDVRCDKGEAWVAVWGGVEGSVGRHGETSVGVSQRGVGVSTWKCSKACVCEWALGCMREGG